jgi:hypothetical protein
MQAVPKAAEIGMGIAHRHLSGRGLPRAAAPLPRPEFDRSVYLHYYAGQKLHIGQINSWSYVSYSTAGYTTRQAVPEPAAIWLFGSALGLLGDFFAKFEFFMTRLGAESHFVEGEVRPEGRRLSIFGNSFPRWSTPDSLTS